MSKFAVIRSKDHMFMWFAKKAYELSFCNKDQIVCVYQVAGMAGGEEEFAIVIGETRPPVIYKPEGLVFEDEAWISCRSFKNGERV